MDRRRFLKMSLAATAGSAVLGSLSFPAKLSGRSPRKILVLGGTSFLGPAVVEAAVVAGHTVTLFNRGITNPSLFPTLEKLRDSALPIARTKTFPPWASGDGTQSWTYGRTILPSPRPLPGC